MERERTAAVGFKMINDIEIGNFRCFEHLSIQNLKQVNVITGASGSGKTALLEALLIAGKGTPDACMRVNKGRAIPESLSSSMPMLFSGVAPIAITTAQGFKNSWSSLFKNPEKPISIFYKDTNSGLKTLTISFGQDASTPQLAFTSRDDGKVSSIVFERTRHSLPEEPVVVSMNQNNQMFYSRVIDELGPAAFYFPSTAQFSETDNVSWFSDLRVSGKADILIKNIAKDFPFIKDLQVLSPAGATGIYAILNDNSVRPLSLVSSGIHKIFSLYCGVSELDSGILLLDEIENGVYYERYTSLWRNLYKMAFNAGNQLFITSHSAECLKALLPVLDNKATDFMLLRTERQGDACIVRQISGQAMRAALHGKVDLRGSIDAE